MMWSSINKNSGGLSVLISLGVAIFTFLSTFGSLAYHFGTTISELKSNILELKDNQITDRNYNHDLVERVTFLERKEMVPSSIKDKLDITSLAKNSVTNKLSNEQFNETLGIIKNEPPKEAMKILEEKSYFKKEQIPSIFTNPSENREDKQSH